MHFVVIMSLFGYSERGGQERNEKRRSSANILLTLFRISTDFDVESRKPRYRFLPTTRQRIRIYFHATMVIWVIRFKFVEVKSASNSRSLTRFRVSAAPIRRRHVHVFLLKRETVTQFPVGIGITILSCLVSRARHSLARKSAKKTRPAKLNSCAFDSRARFVGWKAALRKRKCLRVAIIKFASSTANVNHGKTQAASEKKSTRYASSALQRTLNNDITLHRPIRNNIMLAETCAYYKQLSLMGHFPTSLERAI